MIPCTYPKERIIKVAFEQHIRARLLPTDVRKALGANIAVLLERDGLNAAALAKALDVTPGMVSQWINGKRYPEAGYVNKIIDTMGWSMSELFADPGERRLEKVTVQDAIDLLSSQELYVPEHDVVITIKRKRKPKK